MRARLFGEIYPGAVYLHDGDSWQVVELNLESKTGYAIPFHGNYYTVSGGETNIAIVHEHKSPDLGANQASVWRFESRRLCLYV